MKKLIVLGCHVFFSTALADGFTAAPLKNHPVCLSIQPFILTKTGDEGALPASFIADMTEFITNRLKAYRIPNDVLCNSIRPKSTGFVYGVVTLTGPINNIYRGYSVKFEEFTSAYTDDGVVTLWDNYVVGVSSYDQRGLADKLKTTMSDLIDKFAADYALANP
jgi:hypothetical protein